MDDILTIIAALEWLVLGLVVLRKLKKWNEKFKKLYDDLMADIGGDQHGKDN